MRAMLETTIKDLSSSVGIEQCHSGKVVSSPVPGQILDVLQQPFSSLRLSWNCVREASDHWREALFL